MIMEDHADRMIKNRTFSNELTPLLLDAYQCALETKMMAPSWSDATIIIIHKDGKEPHIGHYPCSVEILEF